MKSTKHIPSVHVRLVLAGLGALLALTACFPFFGPTREPASQEQSPADQVPAQQDSVNIQQVELEPKPAPEQPAILPDEKYLSRAAENSVDGGIAAAHYFWDAWKYGHETGDMAQLELMSDAECLYCTEFMQHITELVDNGVELEPIISPNIDVYQTHTYLANQEGEWLAVIFERILPDLGAREEGRLFSEDSLQGTRSEGWLMKMSYDETAQLWQIQGIGHDEQYGREMLAEYAKEQAQQN